MRLAARSCASFSGLSGLTELCWRASLMLASARRFIERYDLMLRRRVRVADRNISRGIGEGTAHKAAEALTRRNPTDNPIVHKPVPQRYPRVLGEISWVASAPAKEPGPRARCVLPELRPIGRRKAAESRTAAERSTKPVMPGCC